MESLNFEYLYLVYFSWIKNNGKIFSSNILVGWFVRWEVSGHTAGVLLVAASKIYSK